MANLDAIHDQLAVASSLLDAVAHDIRDLGFTPDEHVRRIGQREHTDPIIRPLFVL